MIKIQNATKSFGPQTVLNGISLEVAPAEHIIILGQNGAGKTTLLRCLLGHYRLNAGNVRVAGFDPVVNHRTALEKVAFIPQLPPPLPFSIRSLFEFASKTAGLDEELGIDYCHQFGLKIEDHWYKPFHQLSGGMKQRAGIARAYTNNPEIMLMDEPFGQLDAQTRYSMQDEVLRIWESEKRTFIFVTNNIEEALYLADRIVLLTNYPAQVKEIYDINLPRPRDTVSPEFLRLRKIISDNTDLAL